MATTRVSNQLPPNLDTTKASIAYGQRAFPKLNEELNQEDDRTVRLQALTSLCDLIRDPSSIKQVVAAGIVLTCVRLLGHDEVLVRQLSVEIFRLLANHALGRTTLLASGSMPKLATLFDDTDTLVRQRAHQTTRMLAVTAAGTEEILKLNLVAKLVQKLVEESEQAILVAILETLHTTIKFETGACLESPAMERFVLLIQNSDEAVRAAALEAIKGLSFSRQGKEQAVDHQAPNVIAGLLTHDNARIRAEACGALMSICITTRAKEAFAAIDSGAATLATLVDDPVEGVCLAAIQAINVTAEIPSCRLVYQALLPKLARLSQFEGTQLDPTAIARAAQRASATISWQP